MKHIVSGIQPTGSLNLGTYLGSIRNFVKLQDTYPEHHFMLFIADLHAITIPRDRLELRKTIRELAALYLACGLRRERLSLFIQSEIPAHSQMAHLLQCFTYIGELERMTQFKDKARRQETGVSAALFTYPVLMAGDILLYDAEYVPVGEDQTQHLELTRDVAERVNSRLGDVFTVPKLLTPKVGARIMSLTEPTQKMSKSDTNDKSRILLLDPEPLVRKRIMSAVTDSDTQIIYDKVNKPGISNLLVMLSALTDVSVEELEKQYAQANYGTFKKAVADAVVETLQPIQSRYQSLIKDPELDSFLDAGRDYAEKVAMRKVAKLNHKLGLGRKR